jgi:predicted RNA binding protein YcfA (HicA-like mRNA interferase family)
VKLPRDVTGAELIRALARFGYQQTRQTGSHVRLTSPSPRKHHLTVPLLNPLPVGTLSAIVKEAAAQLEMDAARIVKSIR